MNPRKLLSYGLTTFVLVALTFRNSFLSNHEVTDFINTQTAEFQKESEIDTHSPLSSGYGCSFKLVRKLSTLARPTLLGKFMTQDMIRREDFNKFIEYIKKFGRQEMNVLADPRL